MKNQISAAEEINSELLEDLYESLNEIEDEIYMDDIDSDFSGNEDEY